MLLLQRSRVKLAVYLMHCRYHKRIAAYLESALCSEATPRTTLSNRTYTHQHFELFLSLTPA